MVGEARARQRSNFGSRCSGFGRRSAIIGALSLVAAPACASNIVLTNDDGLTSNVVALYQALKASGHDVIVSVPCTGQSGMGAAIYFLRPLEPLTQPCLNQAAKPGDPGAGPMTRAGLGPDYFYVNGTPVMALLYGLDIQAQARWGRPPDLVLSGPNEGQNAGFIVISSGTVSNAQYAAIRGIPAIALSAGEDTRDNVALSNPKSQAVARLTAAFIDGMQRRAGSDRIMPPGTALNVNFPDDLQAPQWKLARIGTYSRYALKFVPDLSQEPAGRVLDPQKARHPGLSVSIASAVPTKAQQQDEAAVSQSAISVSIMQIAYDGGAALHRWLSKTLAAATRPDQRDLKTKK